MAEHIPQQHLSPGRRRRRKKKRGKGWLTVIMLLALGVFAGSQYIALPGALRDLLARNPETLGYVLGYEVRRDKHLEIDLCSEAKVGEVPHLLQWDRRWGYLPYGGDGVEEMIGLSGCGPTCMSMVTLALTGDVCWDPASVANYCVDRGYYVPGSGTAWALFIEGSDDFGLTCNELPLDKQTMLDALDDGKLLIASVGPGDFTRKGHFIVLSGWNGSAFQIKDPNSIIRTGKTWTYDQLAPQIVALWAFDKK